MATMIKEKQKTESDLKVINSQLKTMLAHKNNNSSASK
jgi:hypothetical protein